MNIKILHIEASGDKITEELCDTYRRRIMRYATIHMIKVPASGYVEIVRQIREEENRVLSKIGVKDFVVLLDEQGKQYNSIQFSQKLQQWRESHKNITFLIGGSYGFSESFKQKFQEHLALSALTLPHRLVRIILLEQLYRAFSILHHEKYHH